MENPKSGSLRRRNYGIGAGCSYLIIVIKEFFFSHGLLREMEKWKSHERNFPERGECKSKAQQPCISCSYIAMKKIP